MFKPWIIYMMMSVSPCERRKTAEGKLVLDATIAAKARRRGVPVLGLETIDEQFYRRWRACRTISSYRCCAGR